MTSSNGFHLVGINHVNVTVPAAFELAAKQFYGDVLGLRQIPKPEGPRKNVGAWYEIEGLQLHLSIEDGAQNRVSDRHVCYQVADIASAKLHLQTAGIEVIPDDDPVRGWSRFFARDPGGNLIEVTQGVVK
ncbi:MAG: VOC family protein [Acidobacteriota bacterium]|nr:VOC family protein [Acidobacteriota bacterium]